MGKRESKPTDSQHEQPLYDFDDWFAAFFDGEGCITTKISRRDSYSTGFEIEPKVRISHSQVTGSIDAEGHLGIRIISTNDYRVGYRMRPMVEVSECDHDRLMDTLAKYGDARDVNYFISHSERDEKRSDQYTWSVSGIQNTLDLLSPIRDRFIVKREQVDLFLDEILPRLKQGVHHEKEGFLEVMSYVDRFNSYKGGSRGKYTLEYFEELWEIEYTPE